MYVWKTAGNSFVIQIGKILITFCRPPSIEKYEYVF